MPAKTHRQRYISTWWSSIPSSAENLCLAVSAEKLRPRPPCNRADGGTQEYGPIGSHFRQLFMTNYLKRHVLTLGTWSQTHVTNRFREPACTQTFWAILNFYQTLNFRARLQILSPNTNYNKPSTILGHAKDPQAESDRSLTFRLLDIATFYLFLHSWTGELQEGDAT